MYVKGALPLGMSGLGQKLTFSSAHRMSALCHKPTSIFATRNGAADTTEPRGALLPLVSRLIATVPRRRLT